MVNFFYTFLLRIKFVRIGIAMCDIVHDLETVFHISSLFTANSIWKSFLKYE